MDNTQLKEIINGILLPYGFKKKGANSWIRKAEEISMRVHLQRSSFGNLYYIRSYYIVNKISKEYPRECECLTNINCDDPLLLTKMCDLENEVPDDERRKYLELLLNESLSNHHFIETEKELKEMLKHGEYLAFLVIKQYLGIEERDR